MTMRSKGNSKIIGAARAPMAAPPSLPGHSCGPKIAMITKTTATALKVTGAIGSVRPRVRQVRPLHVLDNDGQAAQERHDRDRPDREHDVPGRLPGLPRLDRAAQPVAAYTTPAATASSTRASAIRPGQS